MPFLTLLATLLVLTGAAHADPAPVRLVVQLAADAAGGTAALREARALPALTRTRLQALGLRPTRAFAERLAGPRHALPAVYGFAPERIVLVEAPDSALAASAITALTTAAWVDWAEPVRTRTPTLVGYRAPDLAAGAARATALDSLANDPYLRTGWQYGLWNPGPTGHYGGKVRADVHAFEAWRVTTGSNTIKLAVADTGIDPDQPELAGTMPDGAPRLTDAFNATDDAGGSVLDLYGHGTPVAGVMAARTNDGPHFAANTGVAGVCGGDGAGVAGARLVPIKITPGVTGDASSFDIARALLHATDVGARTLNLSFAGTVPTRIERLALTYALLHGCVPVCAAGNSGFDPATATLPLYPAAFAQDGLCLSVGASDSFDRRTLFSSYPAGLDLMAPGVDVMTTFMGYPSFHGASYPGYVAASGTSFAAPFVAGAVGLLASARPDLRDTDFQRVIRESATDLGAPGFDAQTAHGRLDLERMLQRVPPTVGVWHDETPADSFVTLDTGTLRVGEPGPGTMARWTGAHTATRVAALATVTIPDSFLSVTGAWPRVGGTFAVRGDWSLPWFAPSAEVVAQDGERLTLRGWIYRMDEDPCATCDDRWLPLAPSNVRFGFTVMGVVDRAPSVTLAPPSSGRGSPGDAWTFDVLATDPDRVDRLVLEFVPDGGAPVRLAEAPGGETRIVAVLPCLSPVERAGVLRLTAHDDHGHVDQASAEQPFTLAGGECATPLTEFRATPSPFVNTVRVFAPGRGRVRVLDASGRVVRHLETAGGPVEWDGQDARGGTAAAGIYWLRWDGNAGSVTRRVVKLGR